MTAHPSSSETPAATPSPVPHPPVAARRPGFRVRDIHGDHVDDPLDWLRDKDDPEVIAHLEAENAWTDAVCAPTSALARTLVDEFRAHTRLADVTVPVRIGDHWYWSRTREDAAYRSHHRAPVALLGEGTPHVTADATLPGEELLVDENALAEGEEFFRLGRLVPSPDGSLVAWSRDTAGDERWTWVVQRADTGEVVDDLVTEAAYGFAWSADSTGFLHTRADDAWRQHQVWFHRLGRDTGDDLLLLEETDEGFDVQAEPSLDPAWVAIHSVSTTAGQAWLWSPLRPEAGLLHVNDLEREVMVEVEPAGDHLVLVHTRDNREGAISLLPMPPASELALPADPTRASDMPAWAATTQWAPLRQAGDGERILSVEASGTHLAVGMRSGSLTQVEVWRRRRPSGPEPLSGRHLSYVWTDPTFIEVDSPVRSIDLEGAGVFEGAMDPHAFTSPSVRVRHESIAHPPRVEELDVTTGERTLVREESAPGWDPSSVVEERVWVTARDGVTRIPVTLVHRADLRPDGTNPGWLYGYGAYEVSIDADFSPLRLSLLERGVVWAIAHVRGGGEMGRSWYEDGRFAAKVHSFTDFIDVADWLVSSGWVAEGRLAAEGRSAGGLLMGAVLNMAPTRFRAVLAGVPFVDALTTILDPSLPLTVGEWEEWGNPIEDPEIFRVMKGYTPYENVPRGVELPAVMATTALNDTRVFHVEPAKWVQVLREASPAASVLTEDGGRPVVLRTEMVAGHFGRSGRFGLWESRAEQFAFVLGQIGATDREAR